MRPSDTSPERLAPSGRGSCGAAVSSRTDLQLYTSMVCDGLVFHPLQGDLSLGVDAAARVSASSDVLWPPPTGAAEIALAPSADTLKRQQEQHFERRYRARVFGDWHRRCVHPRLPYLAAYGVVGEAAAVAPDIAEPLPLNEVASAADLWSGDALRVVDIGDQARRATADAAQQNATAAAAALHFPECLSSDHKSPSIQLDGDDEARPRRALYGGPGRSDMDAASVRANCPVPPEVCLYYYEMKVIDSGAQGFIGLGLCAGDVQLDRLPGWERNSIGWHGDDGHIFRDSGMGTAYGPKYGTGDIVGCCWNRITGDVYFTKQGALLKRAFRNVGPSRLLPPKPTAPANGGDGVDSARQRRAESWYPVVGLRTCGEVVEVNFGQQPFLFDLETYVRREVEQYLGQLAAAPTAPSGVHSAQQLQEEQRAARRAIVDYLLTEGYDRTARAFLQAMASEEMEEQQQGGNALQAREYQHALAEAAQRAHVMECIERGDIDAALRECAAELTSPTSSAGPRRSARSSGRRNEASRPATRWSDVAVAAADDGGGGDVDNISDAFYATLLLRCQKFIEMLRDGPDHPQLLAALVFARQELWPLVQPEPHSAKPLRALADGLDGRHGAAGYLNGTADGRADGWACPRFGTSHPLWPTAMPLPLEDPKALARAYVLHHVGLLATPTTTADSPLLAPTRRELCSAAVNRALLRRRPQRARRNPSCRFPASQLARVLQHLNLLMELQVRYGHKMAALITARDLL
ncbi:hypothetical protein CDCA_CDCA05G1643 [Cyanidium caldarium]|uniref:B30.2/SPRY domain-containing protein n=1 Tax=Cyanidium caldarium TaxID=2771 RepID=A0AAV9ITL7_CYACA|nr:hypothetical protein CDCA_CDCA05G1643 [Cyanidium caldarium]